MPPTPKQDKKPAGFLERAHLQKLKSRALRAGVWFKLLPRIDRVLVDLTIRVADSIRSRRLSRSIAAVAGKLEGILESKLARAIREFGEPFVCKLGEIARSWGYGLARFWQKDKDFARFWAVMKINGHPCG